MLDKIYVTIRKEIECSEQKNLLNPLKFNLAGNIPKLPGMTNILLRSF